MASDPSRRSAELLNPADFERQKFITMLDQIESDDKSRSDSENGLKFSSDSALSSSSKLASNPSASASPSREPNFNSVPFLFLTVNYFETFSAFKSRQEIRSSNTSDDSYLRVAKCGNRVMVVSHQWETRSHPDPLGVQFNALHAAMKQLQCSLLFYDYSCLPQAPRTDEEKQEFNSLLRRMNDLYSGRPSAVNNLDGISMVVYGLYHSSSPMNRGWPYFEMYCAGRAQVQLTEILPESIKLWRQWQTLQSMPLNAAENWKPLKDSLLSLANSLKQYMYIEEHVALLKLLQDLWRFYVLSRICTEWKKHQNLKRFNSMYAEPGDPFMVNITKCPEWIAVESDPRKQMEMCQREIKAVVGFGDEGLGMWSKNEVKLNFVIEMAGRQSDDTDS